MPPEVRKVRAHLGQGKPRRFKEVWSLSVCREFRTVPWYFSKTIGLKSASINRDGNRILEQWCATDLLTAGRIREEFNGEDGSARWKRNFRDFAFSSGSKITLAWALSKSKRSDLKSYWAYDNHNNKTPYFFLCSQNIRMYTKYTAYSLG